MKKMKKWLSEEEDRVGYKRKKRTLKQNMAKKLKRRVTKAFYIHL
jgi:hypothetical protein